MKSKFKQIFAGVLTLSVQAIIGQNFTYEWAKFIGGSSTDVGTHIAVDNSGNVYTAGRFFNTMDADPSPLGVFNITSAGDFDMFLQKLDASGNFVWAIRIGSTGYDEFTRIAIAPNGDICAVGTFFGTVDFDPGAGVNEKVSAGGSDIAVMRFNSSGNLLWVQTIGSIENEVSTECSVDNNNRILVSGIFRSQCTFTHSGGSFTKTAQANSDAFMMIYSGDGSLVWINTLNGALSVQSRSSAFDANGNVIVAGRFSGTAIFEPGLADIPIVSNGGSDIFVLKLNPQGNLIWIRSYGGASNESVYTITTDHQSNVIVSGYFYSDTDLDPGPGVVTFPVSGDDDCFIQKLNPNGNLVWVRQIGGPTLENTYDVYCDSEGAVYVVGDFFDTVDFDPGSDVFNLTSAGNNDIFTLKLNSAGEFVWAYKIGANFSQAGYAIHVDADKNVYTTGTFSSNVDFNPTSGVQFSGSAQVFDVFTLKIGQSCIFPVISSVNASNTAVCSGENVTIEVNGQLNGATEWVLSEGNCLSGTSQTSVDGVFQITPTETATYFVRGSGGCVPSNDQSTCTSALVQVNPSYIFNESFFICFGDNITLPDGSVFNNVQESFVRIVELSSINACDSIVNYQVDVMSLPSSFEIVGDTVFFLQYHPKGFQYSVLDCNNAFAPVLIEEISGQFGAFLLPGPGSYAMLVEYNGAIACADTSNCQTVLSTRKVDFSKTTVYPNPFTNQLVINQIPNDIHLLEIFNISGQLMHSRHVNEGDLVISDINHISSGLYFVHLSGNSRKVFKVIKQ